MALPPPFQTSLKSLTPICENAIWINCYSRIQTRRITYLLKNTLVMIQDFPLEIITCRTTFALSFSQIQQQTFHGHHKSAVMNVPCCYKESLQSSLMNILIIGLLMEEVIFPTQGRLEQTCITVTYYL